MKGYWPDVKVITPEGYSYDLNFYTTCRLIDGMHLSDVKSFVYERGLVILPEITIDQMNNSVQRLWESGYFNELLPLELSHPIKLLPDTPFYIDTYYPQDFNKEEMLYYVIHIKHGNSYLGCGVTEDCLRYNIRHDCSFFAEPGIIVLPDMSPETLDAGIRSLLQYDSSYFSHLKPWDKKAIGKLRYSKNF